MKDCTNSVPQVSLKLSTDRCIRGTGVKVRTPTDVIEVLRKVVGKNAAQESFVGVYIGSGNDVLATQTVSLGGLDQTAVDPRVLFSGAILAGATAMVIGHNHPSGSVQPSAPDDQLTRQLIEGSKILGVKLLDHIIFSDSDSFSYVQHGKLTFT